MDHVHIDYGPIIKRNLMILLNKVRVSDGLSSPDLEDGYRMALLTLPMHPVLSKDDLVRVRAPPVVRSQMERIVDEGGDLEEVVEYLQQLGLE